MRFRSVRWVIVALLFIATTKNYVDRQTLSILNLTIRDDLHFTEQGYSNIVTAFLVAYTVMYSLGGRLIDLIGVRLGVAFSMIWWSVAAMLTATARGVFSLGVFRFLLGIGEPMIFPAGIRACAELFPRRERALPIGIFSSGSALGAILAPPLIAFITLNFGWRSAFFIPGLVGLLWLPFWLVSCKSMEHGRKTGELAVDPEPGEPNVQTRSSWAGLLRQRKVWAVVLPRLASDPVWYFYIFWLTNYLQQERHMNLKEIAAYAWIPYLFADLGSMGGGALSDWLVRRGVPSSQARVRVLIAVGCLAPCAVLVGYVHSIVTALALICLGTFLCQCWSINTGALAADLVSSSDTATVIGMMGTMGSLGGAIAAQLFGLTILHFGYPGAFVLAGALHPLAALILVAMLRGASQGGKPENVRAETLADSSIHSPR